jgi:arylsulfatase A
MTANQFRHICSCLLTVFVGIASCHADKPNIVIVYVDDMGYGDCTAYNSESKIPTLNIDRLAKEGMRFTDAHSPGATCTASRYGLLTGISPVRTGVLNGITSTGPAIDKNETTVAQMLNDQGYATNMIGKWHLGFEIPKGQRSNKLTGRLTGGPLDRGFDYFHGNDKSGPSPNPIIGRTKVAEAIDESRQNRIFCQDAVRIIKEHAASDQSQPFFLYYALLEPHNPQVPEAEFHGKSEAGAYGDYVVQLDHWLGKVLDVLKETGLEKNTLLIFASDNGASKRNLAKCLGHAGNGVLSGYKAMPLEGGHRVPMIVRWPGRVAASSNSTALINHTDFFATFAEVLNVELSSYPGSAKDSHSFLSALKNPTAAHSRPPMPVVGSYRKADWKLIVDNYKSPSERVNSVALYDLGHDLSEKSNLLKTQPAKAAALLAEYKQYLANREIKESASGRKSK